MFKCVTGFLVLLIVPLIAVGVERIIERETDGKGGREKILYLFAPGSKLRNFFEASPTPLRRKLKQRLLL